MPRHVFKALLVLACFVLAILFARHFAGSRIGGYDDEGYALHMCMQFMAGLRPYTELYCQYGPVFLFVQRLMFHLLRLPVTHDSGRLIMEIFWIGSSAFAGLFTYARTPNIWLACAAGFAMEWLGRVLAFEPNHPQQIIFILLVLACYAATIRSGLGPFLMGAVGTALFFTKINVGIFYFAALIIVLVCGMPRGTLRKIAGAAILLYALLMPAMLMYRHLHQTWAKMYMLIAAATATITVVIGLAATPESPVHKKQTLYALLGAALAALLIVAWSLANGMTLGTLYLGVVKLPLHHPALFFTGANLGRKRAAVTFFLAFLVLALYRLNKRTNRYDMWIDLLRFFAALGILTTLLSAPFLAFPWLSLLPLALIPSRYLVRSPGEQMARLFVTVLAATQILQAYPVAGSQIYVGVAPAVLWCFLCFADSFPAISALLREKAKKKPVALKLPDFQSAFGIALALVLAALMLYQGSILKGYDSPVSSLNGMHTVHLPVTQEKLYEGLVKDVKANCDMLWSMPGMFSFNFWSNLPTPNGFNLGPWMYGISPEEQATTFDRLGADPNACVIYYKTLADDWKGHTETGDLEKVPLARYIVYDMPKAAQLGAYEIRVSPLRKRPWMEQVSQ